MPSLDDNIEAVRALQQTGKHLARLAGYMAIGVQPSQQNLADAQRWFFAANEQVEPTLQQIEASRAASRMRSTFRG
jgi:hypothetical protein